MGLWKNKYSSNELKSAARPSLFAYPPMVESKKRPTAAAEIAAPTATLSKAAQDSNAALVIFYFFSRVLSVKIA